MIHSGMLLYISGAQTKYKKADTSYPLAAGSLASDLARAGAPGLIQAAAQPEIEPQCVLARRYPPR